MGAAKDQGVNAGIPHGGQVFLNHQLGHFVAVHITVFNQRYKQGAGAGKNLNPRHQIFQLGSIRTAADGGRCADHADAFVFGGGSSCAGCRTDHAGVGYRQLGSFRRRIGGRYCAAGRHNELDILGKQEPDILLGIPHDHIVPAGTVRHAAGIAKIHNIFARQQAAQLAHGGQPAKAAVKYADGTSIHQ